MNTKDFLTEKATPFLKRMKTMKKNVKKIHYGNAGENKTLEENCTKQIREINFEFISSGTLQKNGGIEWGFSTIYSYKRVRKVHTGLHENLKTVLWPE